MEENSLGIPSRDPAAGHELTDVNVRGVLSFAGALTVVAVVIHIVVWLFFDYLADRARPPALTLQKPAERAEPSVMRSRLQVEPADDLSRLRAGEENVLHRYAWVDKEKGIVRIPIERAMEIIAREAGTGKAKER